MPKTPRTIDVIIISFNTEYWLKQTLTTFFQAIKDSQHIYQVHVVDNNSADGSVEMVRELFPQVKLNILESNLGFAAANNYVLSRSTADYVFLLNSDIECTQHSHFDTLVEYLDHNPAAGVVSPKLLLPGGEIDPACHRGEPTLWASFTYFTKLEALLPNSKLFGQYHQWYKDINVIHTIDACSGAAMLVKKEVIQAVGIFDERFFMYAEDLDWCKRIREAGYQIVFHPGVSVIHHKNKSGIKSESKKVAKKTNTFFYDTMLQYFDKHYAQQYPQWVRTVLKYSIQLKKGVF